MTHEDYALLAWVVYIAPKISPALAAKEKGPLSVPREPWMTTQSMT